MKTAFIQSCQVYFFRIILPTMCSTIISSFADQCITSASPVTFHSRVRFWKHIYGELDSSSTVIFDKLSLHTYTICATDRLPHTLDSLHEKGLSPKRIRTKPGRNKFIQDAILRSQKYPFIADSLTAHNLASVLKWLPVLESGYLDTMVSAQNAKGLWQFIPSTGKRYGLTSHNIHEPFASTSAFVRYFSELMEQFNDLGLALTAYHHGEGGIKRKLRTSEGTTLDNILPGLGFQSRNYYAKFCAIVEIAEETMEKSAAD